MHVIPIPVMPSTPSASKREMEIMNASVRMDSKKWMALRKSCAKVTIKKFLIPKVIDI